MLGVCNGFQVLCETGLLPGVLMQNAGLKFICRDVHLRRSSTTASPFTRAYRQWRRSIRVPVAHHEGNYIADDATLGRTGTAGDRVAFTLLHGQTAAPGGNPNGAMQDIAGVLSANRRVLGMMPHPERAADPALGGTGGNPLFQSLVNAMETA